MCDKDSKRRVPNRESSIFEGGDGWWHAYVWMGTKPDGRPDRRHRRRRTEAEVRKEARKLERERDAGRARKPGRAPTVEQWFTEWLTNIAPIPRGHRRGLAPRTLDAYWSACRTWIFPHLGGIRVDQLDPTDLDRVYTAMYEAGRAPGHVLRVHSIIRRGLNVALRREKITRNVTVLVDPPGAPATKHTPLTKKQARRVIAEALTRRNGLRWVIGLLLGPRQGEALGLTWSLADLEEGVIDASWQIQRLVWRHGCDDPHACGYRRGRVDEDGEPLPPLHRTGPCPPSWVHGCDAAPCGKKNPRGCPARQQVPCKRHQRGCPPPCGPKCVKHASSCPQRRGGGLVRRRRKGGADHVIGLPNNVTEWLREHRRRQDAERQRAGDAWQDNDLIFCRPDGRPLDPRQDYAEWQDILVAAGVPPTRVHSQRHTAATLLLELGEDIAVVQEVLGHADIRTTRGYTVATTKATRKAGERIGKALLGKLQQELQPQPGVVDIRSRRTGS